MTLILLNKISQAQLRVTLIYSGEINKISQYYQ